MTNDHTPTSSDASTQLTAVRAVGIPVRDQDRALAFYSDTLGFATVMDAPVPQLGGRWLVVAPPAGGTVLALVPASDDHPAGRETGIRLGSADAAADHERLKAAGVDVDDLLRWEGVPPMFAFRDVDGNGLEVTQDWE